MTAHFDDDNDNLWELAESYMDLFPPRSRASLLTDLDKVQFCAWFPDSAIHDNETGTKVAGRDET